MLKSSLLRTFRRSFCSSKAIEAPKKFSETISRARATMNLYDLTPHNIGTVFIAPNATIVGDVFMGHQINIGHGTVIRGDINAVELHRNVYIGDNCVLHTAASLPSGLQAKLVVETDVVIQSGCTLYSCTIDNNAFIGANSVILEGAIIQKGAIILPNSVVPPGRVVPAQQVWGGNPIKFVRFAHDQESFVTTTYATQNMQLTESYKQQFIGYNNAYLYKPTDPNDEKIENYHNLRQDQKFPEAKYNPSNPTV